MNTRWEIRAAVMLILLLLLIAVSSCTPARVDQQSDSHVIEREWHEVDQALEPPADTGSGPVDFQSIADALGCVFAPDTCGK